MEKTEFGKRIKLLRKERELTMDMLVEDVNSRYDIELNKGLVSRWERQENEPALAYARLFADYFGVSLDYLSGTTEVRTPARLLAKKPTQFAARTNVDSVLGVSAKQRPKITVKLKKEKKKK